MFKCDCGDGKTIFKFWNVKFLPLQTKKLKLLIPSDRFSKGKKFSSQLVELFKRDIKKLGAAKFLKTKFCNEFLYRIEPTDVVSKNGIIGPAEKVNVFWFVRMMRDWMHQRTNELGRTKVFGKLFALLVWTTNVCFFLMLLIKKVVLKFYWMFDSSEAGKSLSVSNVKRAPFYQNSCLIC